MHPIDKEELVVPFTLHHRLHEHAGGRRDKDIC